MPLRVAVMGCVVNGPGEAREADLGVASGNGKGQIFVKGKVVKTVPEAQIVETLIEEALRIADEMGAEIPEELRGLVPGPDRHRALTVPCSAPSESGGRSPVGGTGRPVRRRVRGADGRRHSDSARMA